MKYSNIRSISDLDRAIESKRHQLEIQKMGIRQDVKECLDLPSSLVTIASSLRKLFSK